MALFFGGLPLLMKFPAFSFLKPLVISNPGLILSTVIFVILMNARFDLFSFKTLRTGFADNILRVLLLMSAPTFIFYFGLGGISLGVLLYLFLNLIKNSTLKIGI